MSCCPACCSVDFAVERGVDADCCSSRYFNLSGAPTIEGTVVSLSTNDHLPLDAGGIPSTTTPAPFTSITPNVPFTLGATDPDIDDCFVFPSAPPTLDTRASPLRSLVRAHHPASNIHLEVLSTEPAFQFYTGKYIDVSEVVAEENDGESVGGRGARSGFCVEPSRYVDAVNVEGWRGQVVLRKGEVYGSRVVYRAWEA